MNALVHENNTTSTAKSLLSFLCVCNSFLCIDHFAPVLSIVSGVPPFLQTACRYRIEPANAMQRAALPVEMALIVGSSKIAHDMAWRCLPGPTSPKPTAQVALCWSTG